MPQAIFSKVIFILLFLFSQRTLSQDADLIANYPLRNNGHDISPDRNADIVIRDAIFKDGGIYVNGVYNIRNTVDVKSLSKLDMENYSIKLSFKVDSLKYMPIIMTGELCRIIGVYLNKNGNIILVGHNNRIIKESSKACQPGIWYTFLLTCRDTTAQLYLNDSLVGETEITKPVSCIRNMDKNISSANYGNGQAFQGYLKNLEVYNGSLRGINNNNYSIVSKIFKKPKLILPLGHQGIIYSTEFSPDKKWVLTTSEDGTAKIWDVLTGIFVFEIKDVLTGIYPCATFSPDSKWLVVNSNEILIYDVTSWKLFNKIAVTSKRPFRPPISPDSKYVISLSEAEDAKIWDLLTGKLRSFLNAGSKTLSASYSHDGKTILTVSKDKTITIWDAASLKSISKLPNKKDSIAGASFLPDSRNVFIVFSKSGALLWHFREDSTSYLNGITGHIFSASFSPDGKRIACSYEVSDSLKIFSTVDGQPTTTLKMHKKGIYDMTFSPDNKSLISFRRMGDEAKIWDFDKGIYLRDLKGSDHFTGKPSFSNDGKQIVTGSWDGSAKIWDAGSGGLVHDLRAHENRIEKASFSFDSKKIVAAYSDNTIREWDFNSGGLLNIYKGHKDHIVSASFSPSGDRIVTASRDSTAQIWDCKSGKLIYTLFAHTNHLTNVSFSSDGELVLTCSEDSGIKVWNSFTGTLVTSLNGIRGMNLNAYFCSNNTLIVATNIDTSKYGWHTQVWSLQTGKLVKDLHYTRVEINKMSFSRDGKKLVTNSTNGSIETWQLKDWKLASSFRIKFGREDGLVDNYFSFDTTGNYIISIGDLYETGKNVKFWEANTGNFIKCTSIKNDSYETFLEINAGCNYLISTDKNLINVYALLTGKKIYSILSVDTNQYISLTPRGYYKCSPNTAKLLNFFSNTSKVISFDQLDIKYNRPDKVLEAIGNPDTILIKSYRKAYTRRIKKLEIDTTAFREGYSVPEADFSNRNRIKYDQKDAKLTLTIKGFDSSYTIDRFNVWINEVPVFGQKGVSVKYKRKNNIDTSLSISLSQGENRVETSITNINGTESYRVPLMVNYTPDVKQEETTYFIGIGIDRFADSTHNLEYSTKDIRDLSLSLKVKYGRAITIDTLFNENVTINKVKRLKKILQKTSVNDKVIIAYSGHGLLSDSLDYYLSTYPVNFNKPEEKGLPYDDLERLLDSIPARKKLMLIDACHSGEVDKEDMLIMNRKADSPGLKKGNKGVITENTGEGRFGLNNTFELMQSLFVNVRKSTGATIISAAAGNQYAMEGVNNLPNGVFTYSILEAMKNNETMKVSELKKIVAQQVEALTYGLQKPTSRNETIAVDWTVW